MHAGGMIIFNHGTPYTLSFHQDEVEDPIDTASGDEPPATTTEDVKVMDP